MYKKKMYIYFSSSLLYISTTPIGRTWKNICGVGMCLTRLQVSPPAICARFRGGVPAPAVSILS